MALDLKNIVKEFGARTVVREVSLSANEGEFVVLLGPSGCGKTTLLRIVAGLESPDEGSVVLCGRDVTRLDPRDRDIAMVFQSYALYPHMPVEQNIAYPLKIRKRPAEEISRETRSVASRLGLAQLLDHYPRQLSGGERQRVALARAIIRRPKAFLMDEPLSNLDARLRVEMRAELKRLQHELGIVTLYVTHDQAEAMTLAHRIAVMRDGVLQQFATPAEVYHRPANTFVATFVGSPSMNLLKPPFGTRFGKADATLGIRPEDVELSLEEKRDWIAALVWVTEEMGNETLVVIKAGEEHITVRAPSATRLDFETPVWFRPRPEKVHWFDQAGKRMP